MGVAGAAAAIQSGYGVAGVLAVSPDGDDHAHLRKFLDLARWRLREARSYAQAVAVLRVERMPVVICASVLPDGSWIDILSQSAPLMDSPRLIVASDGADDRLRTRVINFGGFGVIRKPLEMNEVIRVVTDAWRHWQKEWLSHARYPMPLTA